MDDDEARLVKDLFKGYNETVRPTEDKQLPIEVKFGIAYTQIVDLVCFLKNDISKPKLLVTLKECDITANQICHHGSI